jgi:hypothetical protein
MWEQPPSAVRRAKLDPSSRPKLRHPDAIASSNVEEHLQLRGRVALQRRVKDLQSFGALAPEGSITRSSTCSIFSKSRSLNSSQSWQP